MTSKAWHQIKAIFEAAAEQPPEGRAAFLDEVCGDDAALRLEVEALLAELTDDAPFLNAPVAAEALQLLAHEAEDRRVGLRVGAYRLVRLVGQGGMGAVYLAERADGTFAQQVAIKFVRADDTRAAVAERLRRERQILATLRHPNIARLLDGGLSDTGPYLVMEYVEGEPIDAYCDRHRLDLRARIDLFRTVCHAVHAAHRSLIVHRDLKPSNIFVDAQGRVKLLDFGIARILDDNAEPGQTTQAALRMLTPAYASPEQIRGEAITTASDVYALGVVLYRLLTGHAPYHVAGLAPSVVERIVCHESPPRPSTIVATGADAASDATPEALSARRSTDPERLQRQLRGDLDNIVLKALHKDPARRYDTAAAFGEDLRRHQQRLPVVARPDTLGYRATRFAQRNAIGVAASLVILLLLIAGIITTTYQARIAEQRFGQVRSLANTMLDDLHDSIRDLPGTTQARQLLVSNAIAYLDQLSDASADPDLMLELALAYEQIGEIQGNPHYTNLGDLEGALVSYQKAVSLREAIWRRDTTDAAVRHALGRGYGDLAIVTSWAYDNAEAVKLAERGTAMLRALVAVRPGDRDLVHDLWRVQSELGWWYVWEMERARSFALLDEAIAGLEALAAEAPDDLDLQIHLWRAYSYKIVGLRFTDRYREAQALIEDRAFALLHRLEERFPNHSRVEYALHIGYNFYGITNQKLGFLESALVSHRRSLDYATTMVAIDSTNQKAYEAVARAHNALATLFTEMGNLDASIAASLEAHAIQKELYRRHPTNQELGNMLGNSQRMLCRTLLWNDRLDDALRVCHDGIATQERVVAGTQASPVVRGNLASVYAYTAQVYSRKALRAQVQEQRVRYRGEALRWYDRSLTIFADTESIEAYDIEVHPDTLAADRDAFLAAFAAL